MREFLEAFPDPAAPEPIDNGATAPHAASPKAELFSTSRAHGARCRRQPPADARGNGLPFTGGRFLADAKRRWAAAVWDLGSLVAIALSVFVYMDAFWMPLGVTALCYYVGGILFLVNSPGVCLFAPKIEDDSGESRPARVPRHRPVDVPVRPPEPMYRANRFRADRHREVGT